MTIAPSSLDRLADEYWEASLELDPLEATAIGERRYGGLLPDLTPDGARSSMQRLTAIRSEVDALAPEPSDAEGMLTRSALLQALDAHLAALRADAYAYTVDPAWGFHAALLSVPSYQPLRDPADGEAMVARWTAMGPALDELVRSLRRGLAEGRLPIASSVDRVIDQLAAVLATPDEAGELLKPLQERPADGWSGDEWRRFGAALTNAVATSFRPALVRFHRALVDEVRAGSRDAAHAGIGHLPGGDRIYRDLVRAHTTLDLSPEEIHAIGLDEVERIDAETAELGGRVIGAGSLAATEAALRDDPELHFSTADEVAAVAARSLERAQAATPAWFGRLPRTPCEVVRMMPHEERHSTIAYYRPPAADGSRPGRYYINTSEPATRPRYEAEALAFHEAVPGHHLQIAIAQELDGLPAFRRFGGPTAYVEGWGLYTERLSHEMGLYSGDLDLLGMLSFDAWRACRLVVDTGLHAHGWSRDRAIEFMLAHSALAENNIVNEVDRYLGAPGQALGYKLGQLEIIRLRREAEERLGASFDVRRFHDAVLGHGPLPLATLRQAVETDLPS